MAARVVADRGGDLIACRRLRSTSVVVLIVAAFIGLLNCTRTAAAVETFVLPLVGVTETMESASTVVKDDVKSEARVPPFASATPPLPPDTVSV